MVLNSFLTEISFVLVIERFKFKFTYTVLAGVRLCIWI